MYSYSFNVLVGLHGYLWQMNNRGVSHGAPLLYLSIMHVMPLFRLTTRLSAVMPLPVLNQSNLSRLTSMHLRGPSSHHEYLHYFFITRSFHFTVFTMNIYRFILQGRYWNILTCLRIDFITKEKSLDSNHGHEPSYARSHDDFDPNR